MHYAHTCFPPTVLGHEELAKRGAGTSDLSTLDADLRARHVSAEEMSLAIGVNYGRPIDLRAPTLWWDRKCDIALLIGTFVHGLGNYEAMRNDEELPFADNINIYAETDDASCSAMRSFQAAATAGRKVFDDALESARTKAAIEVQAAVAAAAAAASEREQDALALRQGGAAADAVVQNNMPPESLVLNTDVGGDNSHFVTLPRLQIVMIEAIRKENGGAITPGPASSDQSAKKEEGKQIEDKESQGGVTPDNRNLSMPDSRILNRRLLKLINEVERSLDNKGHESNEESLPSSVWQKNEDVKVNCQLRRKALSFIMSSRDELENTLSEYDGIGLNGKQCGVSHRSLDDGSDFSIGSASSELAHVAYGTESPRYLRAIGVPMNLTRYAICGLVYADASTVEQLLSNERARHYKDNSNDPLPRPLPVRLDLIAEPFRSNVKLRAAICSTILLYGFPSTPVTEKTTVDYGLWNMLREKSESFDGTPGRPSALFNMDSFIVLAKSLADPDVEFPESGVIRDYVETALLPYCVRLCVYGNGPSTRNARGSKGEYETALGISQYPEPSKNVQSPLPDPCLPIDEHSLEAVANACAILRRVRLMRTASFLASGGVSKDEFSNAARSSFLCKNLDGLPLWWCPWIHDLALLVTAATKGLFRMLQDGGDDDDNDNGGPSLGIFTHGAIVQTMFTTFVGTEENGLPKFIMDQSAPNDINDWIELHSKNFPTANVVERRLAFLCSQATCTLKNIEQQQRYDLLPMFDHGGWPRA